LEGLDLLPSLLHAPLPGCLTSLSLPLMVGVVANVVQEKVSRLHGENLGRRRWVVTARWKSHGTGGGIGGVVQE